MHAFTTFVLNLIDHVGYLGLFIAMVLGNIGAPVGSEVLLPAAGALVATGHLSNIWITIAVAVAAELVGQSIGYAVGFYGGRPFVERYGKYVHFGAAEMARVERFFARWGSFAIFICRFTPVIRGFVGVPAGIAEMPLQKFYLWTFLGSLGFCGGLILLGNALGSHFDQVLPQVHKSLYLLLGIVVIGIVAAVLISRRNRSKAA
ncbi:MAG: DedA family protein [Candidatus Eremiobacteraeota bacterium]|nr:DedA family protein [Candidatus Eremiobacteraeota bacterium]